MTRNETEKALSLFGSGKTISEIGKEIGYSDTAVCYNLRKVLGKDLKSARRKMIGSEMHDSDVISEAARVIIEKLGISVTDGMSHDGNPCFLIKSRTEGGRVSVGISPDEYSLLMTAIGLLRKD